MKEMTLARKHYRCILASALDPLTTYLAINAGAAEGHPLWHILILEMGLIPAMLVRTLVGIVLIVALAPLVINPRVPLTTRTFDMLSVGFVVISTWNLAMMAIA